ncbi:hypothetical protein [Mycobacteroides salmoniphilum]|uniref:hypothetical protein n=1 Tax=Mycobacteroides salmoniphilum TaxID=404941 RepID=UPI001064D9F8|nr:hypothetical protein [Mycobacteroides salmoniphilum]
MLKSMSTGTLFVALAMFATAFASADPADPDPFNPADCIGNANAVCNVGPYGPNSMSNPANPASPMNPNNPANPASPMNPNNPANPASPMNPNNPANPASPMNPMNRPG